MKKEEMKKRGLVFLEDMTLEEREDMEIKRREWAKKREHYDKLDEHDITMGEIDSNIDKAIKKHYESTREK